MLMGREAMTYLGAICWACALGAQLVLVTATVVGMVAVGVVVVRRKRWVHRK